MDLVFEALKDAVNLARNEQIRSTSSLKSRLVQVGYDEQTIDAALLFWIKHVRTTMPEGRKTE